MYVCELCGDCVCMRCVATFTSPQTRKQAAQRRGGCLWQLLLEWFHIYSTLRISATAKVCVRGSLRPLFPSRYRSPISINVLSHSLHPLIPLTNLLGY